MEHQPATGSDIRFNDPPDPGLDVPLNRQITSLPRQEQWRWCRDCSGLWFAGGSSSGGRCPAGGSQTSVGSGSYAISYGFATSGGQNGWRFCFHCHGLWFGGGTGTAGVRRGSRSVPATPGPAASSMCWPFMQRRWASAGGAGAVGAKACGSVEPEAPGTARHRWGRRSGSGTTSSAALTPLCGSRSAGRCLQRADR
jgi:hypothetical protein